MHLPLPLALLTASVMVVGGHENVPRTPTVQDAAGVLVGRVVLPETVSRRWASRYPGAGQANDRVHAVPAVVWLEGDLPAVAGDGGTARIEQAEGRFSPGALAVPVGTTISFPNADPFYHNVFSYSGPRFDLGRYSVGDSRSVTFSEPGVVQVFCEIHEFMRAVVVVTDHGFHAVVDAAGGFRMSDVPDGEYVLHVFHPDAGTREVAVTIRNGVETSADVVYGS